MDTKHLMTFIALAQEKNYVRASLRLNYAPATLADHMRSLENELGIRLMCKAGKQSELTREGELFLPYARKMLELQREATCILTKEKSARQTLRVAAAASLGQYAFGQMLRDFASANENCDLRISVGNCADFCRQLLDGQIDVAFSYAQELPKLAGVETIPLYQEDVYLIAHRSHPLTRKDRVIAEDFEGQRFAFTYGNCCYTLGFLKQLEEKGVRTGAQDYLGNVEMIKQCALSNYGIALLTACSTRAEREEGRLSVLKWSGKSLSVTAHMLCRKENMEKLYIARLVEYTKRYTKEKMLGLS